MTGDYALALACGLAELPISFGPGYGVLSTCKLLEVTMTQVTLPNALLRLASRLEFVKVVFRPTNGVVPRPTRVELKEALRKEVSPHLLRDVGLDDSRSD